MSNGFVVESSLEKEPGQSTVMVGLKLQSLSHRRNTVILIMYRSHEYRYELCAGHMTMVIVHVQVTWLWIPIMCRSHEYRYSYLYSCDLHMIGTTYVQVTWLWLPILCRSHDIEYLHKLQKKILQLLVRKTLQYLHCKSPHTLIWEVTVQQAKGNLRNELRH